MSWKDEEIDKLFQESANSRSFEYKNEYWKEFEKSLPIRDKGKDFLWIATAFLFLGLVTVASVLKQEGVNTPNNGTALTAEINPSVKENNQTIQSNSSNNSILESDLKSSNEANVNVATTSNGTAATSVSSKSSSGTKSITQGSSRTPKTGLNPAPVASELPIGGLTKVEIDHILNTYSRFSLEHKRLMENPYQLGKLEPTNASEIESGGVDQLALRALEFPEIEREKMPDLLAKPNRLVPVTMFYVELNGGVSESIVSPSDEYSNSYGAGFGARMQNGNMSFTAGINGIIANHNDIKLSREAVKVYGFGSTLQSVHLNYRQIYSIEANLSMGWSVRKHTLSFGIRPSYVVGSKVQDRTEINNKMLHDKVVYGYLEGLSRFGLKPQVGYSYGFKHGFTLGANIGVQTQQALNASFIDGENNRFPIDAQIYLRKSIGFNKLNKRTTGK